MYLIKFEVLLKNAYPNVFNRQLYGFLYQIDLFQNVHVCLDYKYFPRVKKTFFRE